MAPEDRCKQHLSERTPSAVPARPTRARWGAEFLRERRSSVPSTDMAATSSRCDNGTSSSSVSRTRSIPGILFSNIAAALLPTPPRSSWSSAAAVAVDLKEAQLGMDLVDGALAVGRHLGRHLAVAAEEDVADGIEVVVWDDVEPLRELARVGALWTVEPRRPRRARARRSQVLPPVNPIDISDRGVQRDHREGRTLVENLGKCGEDAGRLRGEGRPVQLGAGHEPTRRRRE